MSNLPNDSDPPNHGALDGGPVQDGPVQDAFVQVTTGNETALVWCSKCQRKRAPIGRGQCPVCGIWLKKNTAAIKHPVNTARKKQHLTKLIAEYKPGIAMLEAACEDLAGIRERLDIVKPGSPEHQRLIQSSAQLFATLETSRPPRPKTDLTELSLNGLIDHVSENLRHLLDLRDNEAVQHATPFDSSPVVSATEAPEATPPVREPLSNGTEPPSTCAFCTLPAARCSDIHERDIATWRLLHFNDPVERERRQADATAVMFKQAGKPLPDWYRR